MAHQNRLFYPDHLETPVELGVPPGVKDHGLKLVHEMGGKPRNYLHEVSVRKGSRHAIELLQDGGYKEQSGWVSREDDAGEGGTEWWLYVKQYPLSVVEWVEQERGGEKMHRNPRGEEAYIYKADVWCGDCGREIMDRLDAQGMTPSDPGNEATYDSDDYPKLYLPQDSESDAPENCASGNCAPGGKYGKFLKNGLTRDGYRYLKSMLDEIGPRLPKYAQEWARYYDFTYQGKGDGWVSSEMRENPAPHAKRKRFVERYKAFHGKTGGIVGQAAVSAHELAKAESWAQSHGIEFDWTQDDITNRDFTDEGEEYYLWRVLARNDDGNVVGSLGGVDFGEGKDPWSNKDTRAYKRQVEAEIALEAMHEAGHTGKRRRNTDHEYDEYSPVDARELELFIENDSALYRQQHVPIQANLVLKVAKGVYDHGKAVKLFGYLAESGAKKYAKEYGGPGVKWNEMFPVKVRQEVARRLADHFKVEQELGNYDHLLPKKYQAEGTKGKKNPRGGFRASDAIAAAIENARYFDRPYIVFSDTNGNWRSESLQRDTHVANGIYWPDGRHMWSNVQTTVGDLKRRMEQTRANPENPGGLEVTCEKLFPSGGWECSTILGNQLIRRRYFDCSKAEAIKDFREEMRDLQRRGNPDGERPTVQRDSPEFQKGWRAGNAAMKRMLNRKEGGGGLFDTGARAKAYARSQGPVSLQQFIDLEAGHHAGSRSAWDSHPSVHKSNPDGGTPDDTGIDSSIDTTEADALFHSFHGEPSDELIDVEEEIEIPDSLAVLGQLVEIKVELESGGKEIALEFQAPLDAEENPGTSRRQNHPDSDIALLCSSPDGKQLYIRGGDQSLDLDALKMGPGTKWYRDSMVIGTITEITYRTQKHFDQFRTIDYYHKLGEKTKVEPLLTYDVKNELLSIAGGQYEVKPEGIVN